MNKEIGSEFWIDNVSIEHVDTMPNWLTKYGDVVLTSSGRSAISLLLEQINPKNKSVLLPAYICESVILPFINKGYKCFFYDINEDLSPKIEGIFSFNNIGIFLHIGYFGFLSNLNLINVIQKFKDESTIIVEDITHTLFSNTNNFEDNDFYIGSIRKWFGVPSGGFLASKKFVLEAPQYINEQFTKLRKESLLLKKIYIETKNITLKDKFLNQFSIAEEILDNDLKPYRIDKVSSQLVRNLDYNQLVRKRKENYLHLLRNIKKSDFLQPLFPSINDDVCPLFFPIVIKEDRNKIKKKLIEEEIYCPIHWPIPVQINMNLFENSRKLYNTELSIPCDQRYDISDMDKIINIINQLIESTEE